MVTSGKLTPGYNAPALYPGGGSQLTVASAGPPALAFPGIVLALITMSIAILISIVTIVTCNLN